MPESVTSADPFTMTTIPPLSLLLLWESKIEAAHKIATETFGIQIKQKWITIEQIKILIQLHTLKNTREAVRKEFDWLNENGLKPQSVKCHPRAPEINNFRSLLPNSPYGKPVSDFGMSPNLISYICCRRFISGDFMLYFQNKVNKEQKETLWLYTNYIRDKKRFITKTIDAKNPPKRLCLVMNVGRNADGSTYLGSDFKAGCHWSFCIVKQDLSILYCDSLGWKMPGQIIDQISEMSLHLWGKSFDSAPKTAVCHNHGYGRECSNCLLYTSPSPRDRG